MRTEAEIDAKIIEVQKQLVEINQQGKGVSEILMGVKHGLEWAKGMDTLSSPDDVNEPADSHESK